MPGSLAASALAPSIAADRSACPRSTITAPSRSIRARFTGFAFSGRKIVAGRFAWRAANATAAPWLPVLAATTRETGRARAVSSSAKSAPRGLNDPVGSSLSSLRYTSPPVARSSDSARTRRVGRRCCRRSERARSTSSAVGMARSSGASAMRR
jgi:hypothetical protein